MEGGELEKRVNKLRKLSFTSDWMREMGKYPLGVGPGEVGSKRIFFFKLEKSTVFFSAYGNDPVERRT